jgi:hypothetical protein
MKKSYNLILTLTATALIATIALFIAGSTSNIQIIPLPSLPIPAYIFACAPGILIVTYIVFSTFTSHLEKMSVKNQKLQVFAIGAVGGIISLFLLFHSVKAGWHKMYWWEQYVYSGSTQVTYDERYEYRLDIVNFSRFNSYARLHVYDISTEEEFMIFLSIDTQKMNSVAYGESVRWCSLTYIGEEGRYVLETTWASRHRAYVFEIDMNTRTAEEIAAE